jgi:hypothetical protein
MSFHAQGKSTRRCTLVCRRTETFSHAGTHSPGSAPALSQTELACCAPLSLPILERSRQLGLLPTATEVLLVAHTAVLQVVLWPRSLSFDRATLLMGSLLVLPMCLSRSLPLTHIHTQGGCVCGALLDPTCLVRASSRAQGLSSARPTLSPTSNHIVCVVSGATKGSPSVTHRIAFFPCQHRCGAWTGYRINKFPNRRGGQHCSRGRCGGKCGQRGGCAVCASKRIVGHYAGHRPAAVCAVLCVLCVVLCVLCVRVCVCVVCVCVCVVCVVCGVCVCCVLVFISAHMPPHTTVRGCRGRCSGWRQRWKVAWAVCAVMWMRASVRLRPVWGLSSGTFRASPERGVGVRCRKS